MHDGPALGPAAQEAMSRAEVVLGISLPVPLRRLLAEGDGRFDQGGQWWVAWPLARIVKENLAAWGDRGLPRSLLAVGDDGTGDPFCLDLSGASDHVVRWSWIDSGVTADEGTWDEFCQEWLSAP